EATAAKMIKKEVNPEFRCILAVWKSCLLDSSNTNRPIIFLQLSIYSLPCSNFSTVAALYPFLNSISSIKRSSLFVTKFSIQTIHCHCSGISFANSRVADKDDGKDVRLS